MRKMFVVAAREYNAAVRTKAFLISLVLLPTLMGAGILIPMLLRNRLEAAERTYLVLDRTPGAALARGLVERADLRNRTETEDAAGKQIKTRYVIEVIAPSAPAQEAVLGQRFDLSERIRRKEVHGLLEIGEQVLLGKAASPIHPEGDDLVFRYVSNKPLSREFPRWAEQALNEAVREQRAELAGLPYAQLRAVQQPVPMVSKGLARKNPATGQMEDGRDENTLVAFLLPYGLLFLMFMMVFMGAMPLMQGVIEEKTNRIAEVLLGSIPPFQLMLGKLVGTVGVSLTLSGVYLGGAYGAAVHYGYTDHISPEVLAWFLIFQTLGIFFFGSLFIAIGAACTSLQETQTMIMPVTLLAAFPMFLVERVISEPDSLVVACLSFFPPATPVLMITRVSIPPGLPWWQPALGAVLLLTATLACVWAAGRVFRVGLLVQGKGATYRQMLHWLVRA